MTLDRLRDPELLTPTVVTGLRAYFDKALGSSLLYRAERPQYAEVCFRFFDFSSLPWLLSLLPALPLR